MRFKLSIYFLFLCIIDSFSDIRKYDVLGGLSENSVMCILQDHYGYMWFGTKDGINRFNGITFEQFRQEDVSGYVKSTEVFFINTLLNHVNKKDVWIGSTQGLFLFKKDEHKICPVWLDEERRKPFPDLYSLLYDTNGNLWIATHEGLYILYPDGHIKSYLASNSYHGLLCNSFESLFLDRGGRLWVGSNKGLYLYDKSRDKFLSYFRDFLNCDRIVNNHITCFQEDADGYLWFGTFDGGLYRVDQNTMRIESHFSMDDTLYIKRVRVIFPYSLNTFMIGSGDGLYLFNKDNGTCNKVKNYLQNESVRSICRDSEGGIWIGTFFNGVSYLSPIKSNFQNVGGRDGNMGAGICFGEMKEDNNGDIWLISENRGLFYYDVKSARLMNFNEKYHLVQGKISYNNLHALMIDDDRLWIGCYTKGLDVVDLKNGSVKNYSKTEKSYSLPNNNINAIYKISTGRIFIGTESGLSYFSPDKDGFIQIPELNGSDVYCMLEDEYGFLWIATENRGVFRYKISSLLSRKREKNDLVNYGGLVSDSALIASNSINWLYVDGEERLWMGGRGEGLNCFDFKTGEMKHYGENQNLKCYNTYGMLEDDFGQLWISSNSGLICYSPEKKIVKNYTYEDGLQSNQFNLKSFLKTRDGVLYFGGVNGFTSFAPSGIVVNTFKPRLDIKSVTLLGNMESTQSKIVIPENREICLSYKNKSINIEYNSFSFIQPKKNVYRYKLEPIYSDWIETRSNNVSFLNLPAGEYTFRIKGSNNDGYYSDKEEFIRIKISPEPWKSTWAYVGYFILLSTLLFIVFYFYWKSQKEKERKRIHEIEQKKEIESFQSKIQFFTQITHEIKTPLSLIISPLDEVIQSNKWTEDTSDYLAIVKKNVNRLMDLVKQLLDFRKMEQGGYKLNLEPVNVNIHVQEMLERFNTKSRSDIFIIAQFQKNDIEFNLDKEAFTKILSNLFINAKKYARKIVVVRIDEFRKGDNRILSIAVRDDGRGISSENVKAVFEPFYQIPDTEKSTSGIGLGLSLVNSLVKKHKGIVYVNERMVSGCEIIVEIPYIEMADGEQHTLLPVQNDTEHSQVGPVFEKTEKKELQSTILLIDDEKELLYFLYNKLSERFNVFTAENGLEALDILHLYEIDLILCDLMMPKMDGMTFLQKIKGDKQFSHIPLIFLSAQSSEQLKLLGFEDGAEAYIEKPFDMNYLISIIRSFINNRKRQREHLDTSHGMAFQGKIIKKADKEWLDNVNAIIADNLTNEKFNIDILCEEVYMSRSNLQRKFRSLVNLTVGEYIRSVRMEKAYQLLSESDYSISQISEIVGINNVTYFSKCFMKQYGFSPKDIRKGTSTSGKLEL